MPSAKATSTIFRVYKIDEATRDAAKVSREMVEATVAQWLACAIEAELPKLCQELLACGLRPTDGSERPARLPLSQKSLDALKSAADKTGMDQSALLVTLMRRASGATKAKARPAAKKMKKTRTKPSIKRGHWRGRGAQVAVADGGAK